MITGSPTLVARLRELHELREDALAAVLAAETGAAPDDVIPGRPPSSSSGRFACSSGRC
nr:hypothetical protein GCM10020093_061680 [Planobispora longispora]